MRLWPLQARNKGGCGVAAIIERRVCAEIEGPFALFMIGARLNSLSPSSPAVTAGDPSTR